MCVREREREKRGGGGGLVNKKKIKEVYHIKNSKEFELRLDSTRFFVFHMATTIEKEVLATASLTSHVKYYTDRKVLAAIVKSLIKTKISES